MKILLSITVVILHKIGDWTRANCREAMIRKGSLSQDCLLLAGVCVSVCTCFCGMESLSRK